MAMITAYFDESETAGEERDYFVVAGLVADAYRWAKFDREWKHILDEFGVPYLHMRELNPLKGPYKGWSESKRAGFLRRLSLTLTSTCNSIRSISCAIQTKDYIELVSEGERAQVGHAYHFCLYWCIPSVLLPYHHDDSEHLIDFVFDERHGVELKARQALNVFKNAPSTPEHLRRKIAGLSYRDDKLVRPLQAADFLAYEINKHCREPWRLRQSLIALNPVEGFHTLVSRDALAKVLTIVRAESRRILSLGIYPLEHSE